MIISSVTLTSIFVVCIAWMIALMVKPMALTAHHLDVKYSIIENLALIFRNAFLALAILTHIFHIIAN